jgi:hypothetical protein
VLLRARTEDLWASFLNQPIELAPLREQLTTTLSVVGFPQILLRMGYGAGVGPTPRRSVRDVILKHAGPHA